LNKSCPGFEPTPEYEEKDDYDGFPPPLPTQTNRDLEIISHGPPAMIEGGLPFDKNFTPGHEYMGTVVKLGPGVTGIYGGMGAYGSWNVGNWCEDVQARYRAQDL
jgi:hypothetical protein